MITRICVALCGAAVITTALLLGMEHVTSLFREDDGAQVFRINDVILRDRSGRPDRPAPVSRQPDAPEAGMDLPATGVTAEIPTELLPASSVPARITEPELGSASEQGNPERAPR